MSDAFSKSSLVGATTVLIRCERGVGMVLVPGGATTPLRTSKRYLPNVWSESAGRAGRKEKGRGVCVWGGGESSTD